MKFFAKPKKNVLGNFDPVNIFLIVKKNNFRGDLSGISAKMATLLAALASLSTPRPPPLTPTLE